MVEVCEPPSLLALTWVFGEYVSWVKARVSGDAAAGVRLTLTHTAPHSEHWDQYGAGATGVGWELALAGLAIHLGRPDAPMPNDAEFVGSPDGRAFVVGSRRGMGGSSRGLW